MSSGFFGVLVRHFAKSIGKPDLYVIESNKPFIQQTHQRGKSMGKRNYLIEGVSGTGKTSVCHELRRRGYALRTVPDLLALETRL